MKRLSLLAILIFSLTATFAQKGKVSAANSYLESKDLKKAKEK